MQCDCVFVGIVHSYDVFYWLLWNYSNRSEPFQRQAAGLFNHITHLQPHKLRGRYCFFLHYDLKFNLIENNINILLLFCKKLLTSGYKATKVLFFLNQGILHLQVIISTRS